MNTLTLRMNSGLVLQFTVERRVPKKFVGVFDSSDLASDAWRRSAFTYPGREGSI